MQKTLATTAALSGLPLGVEMYLEHYKGSFGDIWMWSPIVTSPLVSAAGVAGMRSPAAARTVLPAAGAVYALNGLIGTYTSWHSDKDVYIQDKVHSLALKNSLRDALVC